MATLTVQEVIESGLNLSTTSAASGGDEFTNSDDERTFLYVDNQDASAKQVTVTAQKSSTTRPGYGSVTKSDAVVSVPAGEQRYIGPFPGTAFNDANGKVQVTYDAVTSVSVAAVKVPKQ